MSRFDDEMIKQAENAFQERGMSGTTTTPRQQPYDQIDSLGSGGWPEQAPAPAEEVADWIANQPMTRQLDVRDFTGVDDGSEIIGGPGSSAVYSEGGPMYASVNQHSDIWKKSPDKSTYNPDKGPYQPDEDDNNPHNPHNPHKPNKPYYKPNKPDKSPDAIDESLYQVYKASREIRDAIRNEVDFDFSNLVTASNEASTVLRFASASPEVNSVIGTVASIVLDIENDLVVTGNFHQASADLTALEGLLQDIKVAATGEDDESKEDDGDSDDTKGTTSKKKKPKKKDCKNCKGKGCDDCEDDDNPFGKKGSNGNQESLQIVDVRDLDDQAGVWSRERVMQPDHQTNVLVPEQVNGEDAGYVPFYNDGATTGIEPGNGPHKQQLDFQDGTNPAIAPYAGTVAAVQASREKIFAAIQVVDRLEKMGMVQHDDRAKHIAKFEQMSDTKLAGFVASIDMFEESGARQPRSQKVAKGNNSLPEMGRLTTASTVTRQDIQSDDWLMTL